MRQAVLTILILKARYFKYISISKLFLAPPEQGDILPDKEVVPGAQLLPVGVGGLVGPGHVLVSHLGSQWLSSVICAVFFML